MSRQAQPLLKHVPLEGLYVSKVQRQLPKVQLVESDGRTV